MAEETPMLAIDRLCVDLSGRTILKDVSLAVPRGGFTAGTDGGLGLRGPLHVQPPSAGPLSIDARRSP